MIKLNTYSSLLDCQIFYVDDCLARGQASSTAYNKRNLLEMFIRWCLTEDVVRIDEITLHVLEGYRQYLYRSRKTNGDSLHLSTQRLRLITVKNMLKRLHLFGIVESGFYPAQFPHPCLQPDRLYH